MSPVNLYFGVMLATAIGALYGCSEPVEYASYKLPPELEGCKTFNLHNRLTAITVMRCPNSTTSVTSSVGKHMQTAIVVDGVSYVPAPTKEPVKEKSCK